MLTNKKRERTPIKSSKENSSSSGSEKYILPSKKDSYVVCKIKGRKALSDEIKKLKNPFTILDEKIISEFNASSINLKEGETFEKKVNFSEIPKEKIIFLNEEQKITKYYNEKEKNKNNIIFSSFDCDDNDNHDKQYEFLTKFLNWKNKIKYECKIVDFCLNYKILFPDNSIEKLYEIIREERSHRFRYHLYDSKRVIMKYFGPRKTFKSLYSRCVLANYHFKYKIFRPTLIFDVAFISKHITDDKEKIKNVIYYELFSLFNCTTDINDFINTINFDFDDTMKFIENTIKLYFKFIDDNKFEYERPLFCLDNYSHIYDENNYLENIELTSRAASKYNLYIIYSIIDQEDQKEYAKHCKYEKIFNRGFCETQFPICYLPTLRNLSEIENYLKLDGYKIPEDYKNIFGENVSFLFKYIKENEKENKEFKDFVKQETSAIKEELIFFFYKIPNRNSVIEKLIQYIDNVKIFSYEKDLLESIPSGYIVINRTKKENSESYNYSLEYCFPLIKSILEEMLKTEFFIDLNHPYFFKLSEVAQGISFDENMNFFFKNETSFFGYTHCEIEKAFDEYCLEFNNKDENDDQIYEFSEVKQILKNNKSQIFKDLVKKYKEKDNILSNKKLIVVFQKFKGKFVDILFFVKKEQNNNFTIVNLQIKFSNTFKVKNKDKKQQPFQMTYLKEKYHDIFGINIEDSYVIYLSLYEDRKKFDLDNEDICIFYSRKFKKLVDSSGKELKKFPFPKNAEVSLISDIYIFANSFKKMLEIQFNMNLNIREIALSKDENIIKIEITKDEITVSIKFRDCKTIFTRRNDKLFKEGIIYYEIIVGDDKEE